MHFTVLALPKVKDWIRKQFWNKLLYNYYCTKKSELFDHVWKKLKKLFSIENLKFLIGVVRGLLWFLFFFGCVARFWSSEPCGSCDMSRFEKHLNKGLSYFWPTNRLFVKSLKISRLARSSSSIPNDCS